MRPIKFRAWDKKEKLWRYFNLEYLIMYSCNGMVDDNGSMISYDALEHWCRYTGLKDHKGKEIFEGDIVTSNEGNKEVMFIDGGFVIRCCPPFLRNNIHKVIGNIYENKELLKE